MMDLVQRFFSREKYDRVLVRKNFAQYFFSAAEHHWISNSSSRVHFEKLFSLVPSSLLETLMTKYPLTFVTSEIWKQQKVGTVQNNIIVVFPEFQRLLATNKGSAVAYLAHELALVLLELEEKSSDNLMAEVAADKFVCDLGLSVELEELLLMLDESMKKRLRLTYLTINHFTSKI
jgi:hypothetical protein